MTRPAPRIAVQPRSAPWIDEAVCAGGAEIVEMSDASAIVWTKQRSPDELATLLAANQHIDWVQLPWAGVEPYRPVIDHERAWSCAKGVYSEPVAEHALAMLLAGFRHLPQYAQANTWGRGVGRNLLDARITILGGGGIARFLIGLLAPFRCDITVVRRTPTAMAGTTSVVGTERLHDALNGRQALVLALPLLDETAGIIGGAELALLAPGAWVVNVARGGHIQTDSLLAALGDGTPEGSHLGGAALDVTDPEPLPDDHPLWSHPNALITPHTANTPEMAAPLLSARITDNVRRYSAGEPLAGLIDPDLGY